MRVIIILALFLAVNHSVFAQIPSQSEYVESSLKPTYKKYNITHVPQGFETCSYNAFLKHADKSDDGFSAGRETMQICFPKYINEITFSDNARRMKQLFLPFFKAICQDQNIQYEDQMDVVGYCDCLSRMYIDDATPLTKIIDPSFRTSDEYQSMALQCVALNKK